jgi:hypothetical protein
VGKGGWVEGGDDLLQNCYLGYSYVFSTILILGETACGKGETNFGDSIAMCVLNISLCNKFEYQMFFRI